MKAAMPVLVLFSAMVMAAAVVAAQPSCEPAAPLPIRVHFADETPRELWLQPRPGGGLVLRDESGEESWSAGISAGVTQQIPGMDAAFLTSFTAIHLDDDQIHDRLYAGDLAGRLWRFDLQSGSVPEEWLVGGLFADLGVAGGGRGFVAPADVTLMSGPQQTSWLNIAIGTANTGPGSMEHRFYLLRDSLAPLAATPLTEADLAPATAIAGPSDTGYYLHLGTAQVLARALTLAGHIHFIAVENNLALVAACGGNALPANDLPLSVTVIRAEDADPAVDSNNDGRISQQDLRHLLVRRLPALTAIQLARRTTERSNGQIPCLIGGEVLPHCLLDTRPRRTWWRREDAG